MSYSEYIDQNRSALTAGIAAGISPQELRGHVGVLGEAFVAQFLGVKLAERNNQRGYDLIDQDGLRVSVKTFTTSQGVRFNKSTAHLVDRIIVVWLDPKLKLHVVYDKPFEQMVAETRKSSSETVWKLALTRMSFPAPDEPSHRPKQERPVQEIYQAGPNVQAGQKVGEFVLDPDGTIHSTVTDTEPAVVTICANGDVGYVTGGNGMSPANRMNRIAWAFNERKIYATTTGRVGACIASALADGCRVEVLVSRPSGDFKQIAAYRRKHEVRCLWDF